VELLRWYDTERPMSETEELARLDALIEAELAIARAEGAYIPEEWADLFRLGYDSALRHVLRTAAENSEKEK